MHASLERLLSTHSLPRALGHLVQRQIRALCLPRHLDRLRVRQHEQHPHGLVARRLPAVHDAALDDDLARAEDARGTVVEEVLDLALQDDAVVERRGAVHEGDVAGSKVDDATDGAARLVERVHARDIVGVVLLEIDLVVEVGWKSGRRVKVPEGGLRNFVVGLGFERFRFEDRLARFGVV